MGGSSEAGPASPPGAGDGEPTRTFVGRDVVARPAPAGPANPPSHPPTEAVPPRPPTEVVRYGPGVPATLSAGQAGQTAERVWRKGRPPAPPRRPRRLRRLLGSALTVILLAASGVVLYLRFHHPPFQVTEVAISRRMRTTCGVDVTGQITTNGAPGIVSYQWLFQPSRQPPQQQSQTVANGQHAVYVTAADEGNGHGSASQTITLQVLGPDPKSASTAVVIRC
jgi:hypothetical protein